MFAAVDVHYPPSGGARAALVLAPDPAFSAIISEKTVFIDQVVDYQPGEFYRRELPPIRAVLADVGDLDVLIIDGYVTLDPGGRPGLGAYAHEEFGVSIIGVAKTRFASAVHAIPVVRGTAKRPLYVTAAGISPAAAADLIRTMTGRSRLPDALRRVDALARDPALVCTAPPTWPRKNNRPEDGIALLKQRYQRCDFRSPIGCPVITARPRTVRSERKLQHKEDQAANRAQELCCHRPVRVRHGSHNLGDQSGHGLQQLGKATSCRRAIAVAPVECAERLIDRLGKAKRPADQHVCGVLATGALFHGGLRIDTIGVHPLRPRLPAVVHVVVEVIAAAPVGFIVVIELNCHGDLQC
jgi:deoxyribonuclease V